MPPRLSLPLPTGDGGGSDSEWGAIRIPVLRYPLPDLLLRASRTLGLVASPDFKRGKIVRFRSVCEGHSGDFSPISSHFTPHSD
jgi:hypothetical protein